MQGRQPNDLDAVVNKLDYTFIDLPELIDVSDEEVEPEPVYTQSVYAIESAPRIQPLQQQQQQLTSSSEQQQRMAISGSYWQQLQQFGNVTPTGQKSGLGLMPGSLSTSLAASLQRQQQQSHFQPQQHLQQPSCEQPTPQQMQPGWVQQQQQLQASQQAGAPGLWLNQSSCSASEQAGGMEEG